MQPLLPFIRSDKGYVYFVTDGEFVKIGWTRAWPLSKRVHQHQTGNGRSLSILAVIPGSQHAERYYHRQFARHRVGGEWFRLTADLAEFIRVANVLDLTDLVG